MCDSLKCEFTYRKTMISLKKKSNQFENEVNYKKIISSDKPMPISYGDRFIPRRFLLKNCEKNIKFASKKPTRDVLSLCTSQDYWRENTYLPTINLIMEITKDRVLQLMDPIVKSTGLIIKTCYRNNNENNWFLYDWPCKPRSKPSASLDTTFDLPDYDSSCDQNLVDWSIRGQIAVSFGHDVIIWQSKEDITMAFDIKCPRSLAYSPSGELLAIGCKSCEYPGKSFLLELWDVSCPQDFCVICGKVFSLKHIAVQCIEWTSTGKQIVCGTHYGSIYVLSVPDMNTVKKIRKHHLPITIIRFSPTMRYLASGDSEGNIVIYNWNMCSVYLYVRSRRKLNVVFDWHPWTGVDLAISEDVPASIVLLHVPTKKIVAYYQQNGSKIAINYISFSKLTGELLVSTSSQDGNACNDYKVLVMSSLDRIVDILKIPDGGARFLMWSPDGTKVATTGNDETLTLWNFYSAKKNKYFKKLNGQKDNSSMESKFGNQFKKWCYLK
ncbi:Protein cortex [Lucilia cuprina]|uniref:Protein cortex n=1 Tax=Lucilia cuprina TaxID=7375 RepID=A0A0L0BXI1_LUCCU|nr:Protein cortex [Lucilia cuprina]